MKIYLDLFRISFQKFGFKPKMWHMGECLTQTVIFHNSYVFLQSRAALSLLGYCYYQNQDFVNAADCYEQLMLLQPEVDEYKMYYAQSLYKACLYEEAMRVSCQIENPTSQSKVSSIYL